MAISSVTVSIKDTEIFVEMIKCFKDMIYDEEISINIRDKYIEKLREIIPEDAEQASFLNRSF